MDETERAVAFLNDKDAAIWSIPPELLPDYIEGKPEAAKRLVESTQRMAEIAAELRQWDALRQAIKFLMACQQAVLDWWENNVLRRGHQISQDHGRLATPAAEQIIQFSDSTLSRWRTSLGDPERYEEKLRQAAYRKAGLEPEENHRAEGTGPTRHGFIRPRRKRCYVSPVAASGLSILMESCAPRRRASAFSISGLSVDDSARRFVASGSSGDAGNVQLLHGPTWRGGGVRALRGRVLGRGADQ